MISSFLSLTEADFRLTKFLTFHGAALLRVKMSWFGWGSSKDEASSSSGVSSPAAPLDLSGSSGAGSGMTDLGMGMGYFGSGSPEQAPTPESSFMPTPVLALDQIKSAGVPITRQMSPYLQMDPTIFTQGNPQYIMPDGGVTGKGKFEFALGHIGWAVGLGFGVGCARGALGEFVNPETRKMVGKPWMTRIVNATVKHGSGYAQPAGAAVFLYSALEIGLRSVRADDDLNGIGAGALAGLIYRSPHGFKASGIGAGVGAALAALWVVVNPDSRQRIQEMFS